MLHFFATLYEHALNIVLLGTIAGLVAMGAAVLLTRKDSLLRSWLLYDAERLVYVGLALIVLAWIGLFFYNRVTGN